MANNNPVAAVDAAKAYGQLNNTAKALAAARNKARKYNVDFIPVLINRLQAYKEQCERDHEPLTAGGFILASGIPAATYYEMAKGDYDHIVEEYKIINELDQGTETFTDSDGIEQPLVPFSDVIEKIARLPLQMQLEKNCYTNRGNPAGSIFGLKAQFDWREDNNTPSTVNNNLVIADSTQAKNIMKMLASE